MYTDLEFYRSVFIYFTVSYFEYFILCIIFNKRMPKLGELCLERKFLVAVFRVSAQHRQNFTDFELLV